jgi:tRNA (cmo5U34)-methyltransferase
MNSIKNFSFDTIQNFDEHIDKSIPNYKLLQEAIVSLSDFVVQPNTAIVDLGCSTGKLLNAIPHNGEKIGIDIRQTSTRR